MMTKLKATVLTVCGLWFAEACAAQDTPPAGDPVPPVEAAGDVQQIGPYKYVVPWQLIAEAADDPEALSQMGRALVHRGPDGAYDGYRFSAIRRDSLPARLGFINGDVVHSINGRPLAPMEEALATFRSLEIGRTVVLDITRRGERIALEWEFVPPVEAPPVEALPVPLVGDVVATSSVVPSSGDIQRVGEKYSVSKRLIDEQVVDAEAMSRMGRAFRHNGPDGVPDGYRISGLLRDSLPDLLGFRNGDIVHSVNGQLPTSAEAVFQSLQSERTFNVEVTRRDQRMTLEYELR